MHATLCRLVGAGTVRTVAASYAILLRAFRRRQPDTTEASRNHALLTVTGAHQLSLLCWLLWGLPCIRRGPVSEFTPEGGELGLKCWGKRKKRDWEGEQFG